MDGQIDAGRLYLVRAACPRCSRPALIGSTLDTVLTVTAADGGKLSLRAKSTTVPHSCESPQITLDEATGTGDGEAEDPADD